MIRLEWHTSGGSDAEEGIGYGDRRSATLALLRIFFWIPGDKARDSGACRGVDTCGYLASNH
jgi:hypothetical protein